MMKKELLPRILLFALMLLPCCLQGARLKSYHDMVLLYGGGAHREYVWDVAHAAPYVSYVNRSGAEKWMFDAFLLLEIHDGSGCTFATGYTKNPATQDDWKKLADHFLQKDLCVGALDLAVEAAKRRIGNPPTKRKVVIGLPEPMKGQKNWGKVSGKELDLALDDDRIDACKWYIDYVRNKFKRMKYKNIELVGFYWIAEEATNTRTIIHSVGDYLNKCKLSFNWIPWFRSDGFDEWKALGFNYSYLQPNYFFDDKIPYSRLNEACELAKEYDLDMEMEFDERILSGWGYRLDDYMKAFKENGCWQTKRLAYYQGSLGLYELYRSQKDEDKALYHRFCEFVVNHPVK